MNKAFYESPHTLKSIHTMMNLRKLREDENFHHDGFGGGDGCSWDME